EATRHDPRIIEGELVAREDGPGADFDLGERVFHDKFGYGSIASIDGNKLTIDFEKAGRKRVLDSFVERHYAAHSWIPASAGVIQFPRHSRGSGNPLAATLDCGAAIGPPFSRG
ncbi:MAG: DUF3553 domain-containing protein, partial [Hyphomicrobiales bacterium]